MRVILPYTREEIPEECHIVQMPDTWVGEALSGVIRSWCTTQPILIEAPTGQGKTEFVRRIARYQQHRRGKVLLLVHRTAIAVQQKAGLAKALQSKWAKVEDLQALAYADEALEDVSVTVMTYQRFAVRYKEMNLKDFAWVVGDEVHYFYSDAAFNPHLDSLFWKLPVLFRHAHRLYLSATPGTILPLLCQAEEKNLRDCRDCRCLREGHGKLLLYRFPHHFSSVDLHYYRKVEEIADLVKSYPEEKFLIFTSTRESERDGGRRSYMAALKHRGIQAVYLDRFSKGSIHWNDLCKKERFTQQVLVCTSVLDCGVNIKDPALRHIVVETTDRTEFLQMLGRKRLMPGENIHVYLWVPDRGTICRRLSDVRCGLHLLQEGERAARAGRCDALVYRGWNDESTERRYMHLFNYTGKGHLAPKRTASLYLHWQEATLQSLLDSEKRLGDGSALPRLAHQWLEQPDGYAPQRWLGYNRKAQAKTDLMAFLTASAGSSMDRTSFAAFSKEFTPLANAVQSFPHDSTRTLGHQAINSRLNALGLPFQVLASNGTFTVFHKEENRNV